MENLSEENQQELSQRLNEVWLELQEFYHSATNGQGFRRFKNNLKKVILIENEITACKAGFELVKLNLDEGYEILKSFGINYTDEEDIRRAILRKETKLDFAKATLDRQSNKSDKKEVASFYKILASVERQLNRQLNLLDINLERWVSYLQDIKSSQEAQKEAENKRKSKRR